MVRPGSMALSDRYQLATREIHHIGAETTMILDPSANWKWIETHQSPCRRLIDCLGPKKVGAPSRMKAEQRPPCSTKYGREAQCRAPECRQRNRSRRMMIFSPISRRAGKPGPVGADDAAAVTAIRTTAAVGVGIVATKRAGSPIAKAATAKRTCPRQSTLQPEQWHLAIYGLWPCDRGQITSAMHKPAKVPPTTAAPTPMGNQSTGGSTTSSHLRCSRRW